MMIQVNKNGESQTLNLFIYQAKSDNESKINLGEFVQLSQGEKPLYLADVVLKIGDAYPILNADSTTNQIADTLKNKPEVLVFDVRDFRDGRVFSLVRHARHLGFDGEIYVQGSFALDQANYFVKSGVDAFLVEENCVPTLQKTLQDLASAYDGCLIGRLPLFSEIG